MTIHQISIFIENRSGTLIEVLDVLKHANIQIIASTIADTAEYGIYRIICDNPSKAYEALRAAGISAVLSDVFALELDDEPGSAADALRILSEAGVTLTYMYSFLLRGKGILIFRTEDVELASKTISEKELKVYKV